MLYTSINNPKIKKLKKLKEKKYRDEEDMFLVEGKHLTSEAFNNGYLTELLVKENSDYKLDIETNEISENVVKYLSDLKTPTGIFGICKKKKMKLKKEKYLS